MFHWRESTWVRVQESVFDCLTSKNQWLTNKQRDSIGRGIQGIEGSPAVEHRLSQLVSYFLRTIINDLKLDPKINSRLLVKHISRPSKLLGFHYMRIGVLYVVHIGDKEHQYQPAIYIYIIHIQSESYTLCIWYVYNMYIINIVCGCVWKQSILPSYWDCKCEKQW